MVQNLLPSKRISWCSSRICRTTWIRFRWRCSLRRQYHRFYQNLQKLTNLLQYWSSKICLFSFSFLIFIKNIIFNSFLIRRKEEYLQKKDKTQQLNLRLLKTLLINYQLIFLFSSSTKPDRSKFFWWLQFQLDYFLFLRISCKDRF